MTPGTRIRVTHRSVWPERVGCEGVVVTPRADGVYPQPCPWEVLILLDDDPLRYDGSPEWWTCVIGRRDVEVA